MDILVGRIIFAMDSNCDLNYCSIIAQKKAEAIASLFDLKQILQVSCNEHGLFPDLPPAPYNHIVYNFYLTYKNGSIHKTLNCIANQLVGGGSPFLFVAFQKPLKK